LGIAEGTFVLVSVGNFGPAKNQPAIIDAARQLATESPTIYIHCGGGSAELKKEATVTENESYIRFAGAVSEIKPYLSASDVFVSTSLFEGRPISLLEAAAAGIPCITTKVGIAGDLSGMPGITFIEPNSKSLYDAITKLRMVPLKERQEMASQLRNYVLTKHVPGTGGQEYADIYRRMTA